MKKILAALAILAAVLFAPFTANAGSTSMWSATETDPMDHAQTVGPWTGETLRFATETSEGGTELKVDLDNSMSTATAVFSDVTVAEQLNQQTAQQTPVSITFAGSTTVTLAPGVSMASDPIDFPTTAAERILVSIAIPSTVSINNAPMHTYANETNYVGAGDVAGSLTFTPENTFSFYSYFAGLYVNTTAPETIAAVGDSITDTGNTPVGSHTTWPSYLAARLAPEGKAVVNEGISGNWVTQDQGASGGPSVTDRWNSILNIPGLNRIIMAGGINDLRGAVSAATLETAVSSLIQSAHAAGIPIDLTTITPCAGASGCTPMMETQRQLYNSWVPTSGADGYFYFSSAVANGPSLAPPYNSGDNLHPNSNGEGMLANVIGGL